MKKENKAKLNSVMEKLLQSKTEMISLIGQEEDYIEDLQQKGESYDLELQIISTMEDILSSTEDAIDGISKILLVEVNMQMEKEKNK